MLITGKSIQLRTVEKNDAQFILSLRLDDALNKYLSPVSHDLQTQYNWIDKYKIKEKESREFYFIIQTKDGESLGTVRIYDIRGNSFCWGSWILKQGAPVYAAIETALCVYVFGFEVLGHEQSHFDVRKDNAKVNAFHRAFGAVLDSEDELNYYYHIPRWSFEKAKVRYRKYLPPPDAKG